MYEPKQTIFIKNKYRNIYFRIIKQARLENRLRLKQHNKAFILYENHHIFPISLFPEKKLNTKYQVLLTCKEHFIVHHLLTKFTVGNNKYKMLKAYMCMTLSNKKQTRFAPNTTQYERMRYELHLYLNSPEYKSGAGSDQAKKRLYTISQGDGMKNFKKGLEKAKETKNSPEGKKRHRKSVEKTKEFYSSSAGKKQKNNEIKKIIKTINSPEGKQRQQIGIEKAKKTKKTTEGKQRQQIGWNKVSIIRNSEEWKILHRIECDYCGKIMPNKGLYTRYHGENCKKFHT